MFCRNCGKELLEQAVACTGCGMNPKEGCQHCPSCGTETKEKQIICTACGGSLENGNSSEWSTGVYIGLLISSVIIPLIGFIYGGIQVKKAHPNSKRKDQAWHFVIAGVVGFIINIVVILD